jgi:uncharacterized short protein YbdD (DUF466 family)
MALVGFLMTEEEFRRETTNIKFGTGEIGDIDPP